jgi:thiamine kinase-like enzyme
MSNAEFQAPGMPGRIAEVLRRLHAGPRFRDDFDMFRLTDYYLGVVDQRSIRVPDGYRDELPKVTLIEGALLPHPLPTVPCHNDLLAENYLDDGARLWIVDYEYSGNNDPTFELGNTAQELGFDAARQEELCAAYFGDATPALLARMRLQMIMSDVGWTLWAAIQAAISSIDYDFWGWAEERWGRAASALGRDDFDDLLGEAMAG